MQKHTIYANDCLKKNTKAYYTLNYYPREDNEDTRFILDFKNTFGDIETSVLNDAKIKAEAILKQELASIISEEKLSVCTVVAVPRAKAHDTYLPQQLYLIDAISNVAQSFNNIIDGTTFIERHTNTETTHLPKDLGRKTAQGKIYKGENANDGKKPYCGITKDTCNIDIEHIKGQTIILVDDIYTKNCNIDEDCIQALYDAGAKEVIFYSFAKTTKRVV